MENIWEKATMLTDLEFYEDTGSMRISMDIGNGHSVAELSRTEALALAEAIIKHFKGDAA